MDERDGMPQLTLEEIAQRLSTAGAANPRHYLDLIARTIWLGVNPDREPEPLGSRFGGPGMAPAGFQWPMYGCQPFQGADPDAEEFTVIHGNERKSPLFLIAQLNLSEIPLGSALPRTGLLSFFTDPFDGVWGNAPEEQDGYRVMYSPQERFESLVPHDMPERSGDGEFSDWEWPCYAMDYREKWSLSDRDAYRQALAREPDGGQKVDAIVRQICGYSFGHFLLDGGMNHQHDPREEAVRTFDPPDEPGDDAGDEQFEQHRRELERRARLWTTLLSITQDDYLKPVCGDTGGLSFVIRKADLAQRRFDRISFSRS